ncbi:exodeoxyribonuclease V subunit beta [Testudinibacter sp. TR-2022]|uniref:exodeoxyribonuclease V subunit beta n=1 Tax=Testudinibacter sp. TR-2022 TaxID=2585029 RepID=UPI00111BC6A3|nr:exodeoxyribonuclease V subunit beta [Testudinibacter sp. TR-2022]TNH05983.1 exodeoxyribonuclease V subunit beta [Pasteurellaceae bacterium Phil11]TNH20915.1 exodeoxyribonuclease V subunit beta [Testudinibacter sp. TR-2022]TNH23897.1 exodeoxyribonuclease V subunit beta [Testudinibacter sp. TR-2022]
MQKLNPITHPLSGVSLIEASAGTGKTYTMVALYLRLLLNIGENGLGRALTVEQILVMTFTKAATQELKERIRSRIVELKALLQQALLQQASQSPTATFGSSDPFLHALYLALKHDLPTAILRLETAQQDMDTAAIFTIHGFCQRMLTRHAFHSGIAFDPEMVEQQDKLLLQLCREYWREQFYPQNLAISRFIDYSLQSPQAVLDLIKPALDGEMPQVRFAQTNSSQTDINSFLQQDVSDYLSKIQSIKQQWLADSDEICALFLAEINRKKDKRLDGRSYQQRYIVPAIDEINTWAASDALALNEKLVKYFSQTNLDQKTKGEEKITHPLFAAIDQIAPLGFYQRILLWHYIKGVRAKLAEYKAGHKQMSFGDLLSRLKTALYAQGGNELAQLIRRQFPFAMVDEFQDTDAEQYQIFKRLYLDQADTGGGGMIMIGDPKQSIYAFRNADIFTYLSAAQTVSNRFTLDTNWRSTPALIGALNTLFAHNALPFIYPQIQYQAVNAGKPTQDLLLNGVLQKPLNFMLSSNDNTDDMAQACAISVQQWLKAIEQGQCLLGGENGLAAKDFAVLVRNKTEADKIKSALALLGIRSVYLSDRSSVLNSEWAQVLRYLLTACLNPHREQAVMTVLASRLFGMNAAELYHLRRDEKSWEQWIAQFLNYQSIWQTQGVLPMIHRLLQQQNLPPRLLAMPDGERAMTDILHLAEFLQQGATANENEHALLSWFERQLDSDEVDAEQVRLRLESERDLVKIVTVHKSKGLEYGVVWLPFVGAGYKPRADNAKTLQCYHDSDNQLCWDLALSHRAETLKEKLAEELRLFYVAATRARYQLNIGFAAQMTTKHNWNALAYLLSERAFEQDDELSLKNGSEFITGERLAQRFAADDYTIMAIESLEAEAWQAAPLPIEAVQAAEFNSKIENNWRISSFTALVAMHQRNQMRKNRVVSELEKPGERYQPWREDDDGDVLNYEIILGEQLVNAAQQASDKVASITLPTCWQRQPHTPFNFPSGSLVGSVLHDFLQHMDFSREPDPAAISELCRRLELDDTWLEPLVQWLWLIGQTPLSAPEPTESATEERQVRLQGLLPQDCLKELAFLISVQKPLRSAKLNRLLQQYPPLCRQINQQIQQPVDFDLDYFKGMLRGFIDLVCRIDGKYYLIDYKSNRLGDNYVAYLPPILNRVMAYHHYDLQYLIYTLALHRYLRQRDANYDYQRDFGGVYYLFLRGLNGENAQTGVYFDKPDWRLIDGLDNLLAE